MRTCIAGLLLLASTLCHGQFDSSAPRDPFGTAASRPVFLPVEEAYQLAVEIQEDRSLRLYWQIAESYYLYQHRFSFKLTDARGDIDLAAKFPEAVEREDEYFGRVRVYYHSADLLVVPERQAQTGDFAVTYQGCADAGLCYPPTTRHFKLDFASGAVTARETPPNTTAATGIDTGGGLAYMLLLAFLGGTILNLMPCVFPILSLKVLGFTRSSAADRHLHGWVYAGGVIASFILVAGLLITLQQAGRAVGWGFQLQSPGFVIALAYLFVVMGLALSGLINLGAGFMNTGSSLAGRGGLSGSFFTGVLAVVVASPCTAPFMGSALGYAVTQPPAVALLVFAALGCGMAAPLLLLSYSSWLRRFMPRPGPWMETLQQLLAFPLFATAIWLFWVAGKQAGVDTMAAALAGALMLGMGLWLWRDSYWLRGLAMICVLSAIGLGSWRGPDGASATSSERNGRIAWSDQQVQAQRAQGKAVFVDVTADWCITCIANEKAVLHTDDMMAAFASNGIVYMVADWTNYNEEIAALLRQHGRTGIPLYLLYPADPGSPPLTLPQLLTRSTVLEALAAISPRPAAVADLASESWN
jgi:thiol:disulfide interchange protein DsbD